MQKKAAAGSNSDGGKRRPTLFEQNGDLAKVKERPNSNEAQKQTEASSLKGKPKKDYDNTGLLLLPGLPVKSTQPSTNKEK